MQGCRRRDVDAGTKMQGDEDAGRCRCRDVDAGTHSRGVELIGSLHAHNAPTRGRGGGGGGGGGGRRLSAHRVHATASASGIVYTLSCMMHPGAIANPVGSRMPMPARLGMQRACGWPDGSARCLSSVHVLRARAHSLAGVGEAVEDLQPFDAEKFADALFPQVSAVYDEAVLLRAHTKQMLSQHRPLREY